MVMDADSDGAAGVEAGDGVLSAGAVGLFVEPQPATVARMAAAVTLAQTISVRRTARGMSNTRAEAVGDRNNVTLFKQWCARQVSNLRPPV